MGTISQLHRRIPRDRKVVATELSKSESSSKGVFKMFDLKTISGKNSVGNRLKESIGQTNCVLLNIVCDYNVRNLTLEIKRYFESNADAFEVLIFTGRKEISIKRNIATSRGFLKMMMKSFRK